MKNLNTLLVILTFGIFQTAFSYGNETLTFTKIEVAPKLPNGTTGTGGIVIYINDNEWYTIAYGDDYGYKDLYAAILVKISRGDNTIRAYTVADNVTAWGLGAPNNTKGRILYMKLEP